MIAHDPLPIHLQRGIILVSFQIFNGFQITDAALSAIKDHRYAVRAVARCMNDLSADAETFQKIPAFLTADDFRFFLADRFIMQIFLSGKNRV